SWHSIGFRSSQTIALPNPPPGTAEDRTQQRISVRGQLHPASHARFAPPGLMGGQVKLPGGSHCSAASRCPLPQTGGVVTVVVVVPGVLLVLVVVVVIVVVLVARHSLSSVRVQLSRQRMKAPLGLLLLVNAPPALLPHGTSPSQTSLHST